MEGARTVACLRAVADAAAVPVSVQLDHATDLHLITIALRAGVDAVLADGSRLTAERNAAFVRTARELSGPGVTVEAELGSILGDEDRSLDVDPDAGGMTDPDDVAEFVDRSGCDLLAVAIGNLHGRYRGRPQIDQTRLARIREVSRVPLVLHGASGLPAVDLAHAGVSGIGKVNVNTELRGVVLDVLDAELATARGSGDDVATLTQARARATRQFATSLSRLLAGGVDLEDSP